MQRLLIILALALTGAPALSDFAGDRAACEGRVAGAGASEREAACSAILSEPGLPASAVAMTLVHRAWARILSGRRGEAMADYNRAVALMPGSYVVLNERALLNLREGRVDAALTDYNAALKAKPGEAYPLYGRGLAYLRKGDRARGEADLRAARIGNSGVDEVFRKIGMAAPTRATQ